MSGIDAVVQALVRARERHEPCDQVILEGALSTDTDPVIAGACLSVLHRFGPISAMV